MKLTADGDKELWVLESEDWGAPLYCTPVKDERDREFWVVQSAEFMGHMVDPQIRLKMQPLSVINETMRWVVPRGTLPEIAVKATGITPRYYARNSIKGDPAPTTFSFDDLGDSPDFDEDFLRAAYVRSGIGKIGVFKTIWRSVVEGIAYQLLVENKPVDFGWFKIHALPYRANWKGYITSKHPRLQAAYAMTSANRAAALRMSGVEEDLMRTDLMAVKGDGRGHTLFQWSLEVEKKKPWFDYEQKLEQERLAGGGQSAYINRWGTIINRLRKTIHETLFHYLQQTSLACGIPSLVGNRGEHRLVPHIPTGNGRGALVGRPEGPLVGDGGTTSVRGPGDQVDDRRPARKVQVLPILRPENTNLRHARGDLEKSKRARKIRLLVPATDSGSGPEEAVLGGGPQSPGPGVA